MSDGPNDYEFPFRTNFEFKIMAGWLAVGFSLLIVPMIFDVPYYTYRYFGIGFIVLGVFVGRGGFEIYHNRKRLRGHKVEVIDTATSYVLNDLFQVKDKALVKTIIENKKKGR
jgi:hypothetical protein